MDISTQTTTQAPLTDADREFLAEWNQAGTVLECGCCDSHGHRV